MTKLAWSTLFVFTLILEIEAYKNSGPLPKPRCKQPNKVPSSLALLTEEGVIENGTLVIRKELIVTKEDPEPTSEYHLVWLPGYLHEEETQKGEYKIQKFKNPTFGFLYLPFWVSFSVPSTTSCKDGVWTNDPSAMACLSSCGVPPNPDHGKYYCYSNPSSCYLTCESGYVTGSSNTVLNARMVPGVQIDNKHQDVRWQLVFWLVELVFMVWGWGPRKMPNCAGYIDGYECRETTARLFVCKTSLHCY